MQQKRTVIRAIADFGDDKTGEIFKPAVGWFDLGNYVEAFNELDNLPCTGRR